MPKSHSDETWLHCKFLHTFDPLETCPTPDFQNCRVREKSRSCLCASCSPQLKKSIWMKGITDRDKTYQVIPLCEDSKHTVTHAHKCAHAHTHRGICTRIPRDYMEKGMGLQSATVSFCVIINIVFSWRHTPKLKVQQTVCKMNICVPYQMPSIGICWKADFIATTLSCLSSLPSSLFESKGIKE